MAINETDVIDSQILAENVSFLDNCFDNTFTLHNSLISIKDYVADTHNNFTTLKCTRNITSRRSISSTKSSTLNLNTSTQDIATQEDKNGINYRVLKNWGLPDEIVKKYEHKGITEMFDWQVSCLSKSKVLLDYGNLVYSAPTSAGKTLVAEILTIKTILERHKKF